MKQLSLRVPKLKTTVSVASHHFPTYIQYEHLMKLMVTNITIHNTMQPAYALLGCEEYNAICGNCHAHDIPMFTLP